MARGVQLSYTKTVSAESEAQSPAGFLARGTSGYFGLFVTLVKILCRLSCEIEVFTLDVMCYSMYIINPCCNSNVYCFAYLLSLNVPITILSELIGILQTTKLKYRASSFPSDLLKLLLRLEVFVNRRLNCSLGFELYPNETGAP